MAARLLEACYPLTVYELAMQANVPLPATAAAHQATAAAHQMTKAARIQAPEEDFSGVIRLMEQLAGLDGEVVAGTTAAG